MLPFGTLPLSGFVLCVASRSEEAVFVGKLTLMCRNESEIEILFNLVFIIFGDLSFPGVSTRAF